MIRPLYTEERPKQRRRQREREQLLERWSVRPGSERSVLRTLIQPDRKVRRMVDGGGPSDDDSMRRSKTGMIHMNGA